MGITADPGSGRKSPRSGPHSKGPMHLDNKDSAHQKWHDMYKTQCQGPRACYFLLEMISALPVRLMPKEQMIKKLREHIREQSRNGILITGLVCHPFVAELLRDFCVTEGLNLSAKTDMNPEDVQFSAQEIPVHEN